MLFGARRKQNNKGILQPRSKVIVFEFIVVVPLCATTQKEFAKAEFTSAMCIMGTYWTRASSQPGAKLLITKDPEIARCLDREKQKTAPRREFAKSGFIVTVRYAFTFLLFIHPLLLFPPVSISPTRYGGVNEW